MMMKKMKILTFGLSLVGPFVTAVEVMTGTTHLSGSNPGILTMEFKNNAQLLEKYEIFTEDRVAVQVEIRQWIEDSHQIMKRDSISNLTRHDDDHHQQPNQVSQNITLDMTPAKCTSSSCYTSAFQPPDKRDCDVIFAAQAYNSTGSLVAFPGTFVLVYHKSCAVVFQNPLKTSPYNINFNWAQLGAVGEDIARKCFNPKERSSIGGVCEFDHYLKFKLDQVMISLQKFTSDQDK